MVGCCVARLLARFPAVEVTLVDVDASRAEVAAALGAGFARPDDAAGGCDLVVHTSATSAGLQARSTCSRPRARCSTSAGTASPEEQQELQKTWDAFGATDPARVPALSVPGAHWSRPQLPRRARRRNPDEIITVVIPEVVVSHWYAQPLHNQSALALKARLLFRPNTVVTSVPTLVE